LNKIFDEQLDLKKELFKYLSYWKYFLISSAIALCVAYFHIRYINPVFLIEAKIKILEENNRGLKLPIELLGLKSSRTGINLENEMETMKTRKLLGPVVTQLNLTSTYSVKGKIRDSQLWNTPITVTAVVEENTSFRPFVINIKIKKDGYVLSEKGAKPFTLSGSHVRTKIRNIELLIEPNVHSNNILYDKNIDSEGIDVKIVPFKMAVGNLVGIINVSNVGKESDILSIKINDVNTDRGIAVVDKIVEVFNDDGINDRRFINKKTVEFIDDRFKNLKFELDSIENEKRDFKKSKVISFIEADAAVDVAQKANSDGALFLVETQIALSNMLKEAVNKSKFSIIPANIGLENSIINDLISQYNTLILQRERIVQSAGKFNPVLEGLDSQISVLKSNIDESIFTYTKQLKISLSQQQSNFIKSSDNVLQIPSEEKTLRNIERQQMIKENLYLLLLQKREESAIAYAVTSPSIKIIEYANASSSPILPQVKIIFLVALFIGLAIPFSFIFIYNLLDTKIKDVNEIIARKSEIPVIAETPFFKDFKLFKDKNDRSVHAESFRILSSNVNFSLPLKEDNVGQVILVTSSIMGEGKTFIASNLSFAFASYNKKVLLVGADMRKPKLDLALEMIKPDKGLSTYLHDKNTTWKDVVVKNNLFNENVDVIFCGIIPPNPSSIISNGRFESFINAAKLEYDYIVIDSAPTIYVNDTFLIGNNADLTLYLLRQDHTEKQLIDYCETLKETAKLKNIVFVFNGSMLKTGYGYGRGYNYGYGYGYSYSDDNAANDGIKGLGKKKFKFIRSYFNKSKNS